MTIKSNLITSTEIAVVSAILEHEERFCVPGPQQVTRTLDIAG